MLESILERTLERPLERTLGRTQLRYNNNLFLDDHVPEVSKGGWFRSRACNEPLWAAGNENLFVRVLGFHPATVEDNLAGVEVTNLVARKNIRG